MLPLLMMAAPLIGKILSGAAKGSSDQRQSENQQALQQAQAANQDALGRASLTSANANTRAGMANDNATSRASMQNADNQFRAGLDLSRKQFTQNEPSVQARQALTGSLMSRIQPLKMQGMSDRFTQSMPKMNSIIDAIGPEAREAGSLLAQRGLSGLQNGPSKFADIPGVSLPDLTLPDILSLPPAQVAQLQKAGLLEKIMGGAGIVGSLIGSIGQSEGGGGNGRTYEPSDQNGWG